MTDKLFANEIRLEHLGNLGLLLISLPVVQNMKSLSPRLETFRNTIF